MRDYTASQEAKAVRARRAALHRVQLDDPLAKRAKSIAFWKECSETNRGYIPHNGAWWWSFTVHKWGRRMLMPRLRAMLDERERAAKEKYRADLRASAARWAQVKAERAAEKARDKRQDDLFARGAAA